MESAMKMMNGNGEGMTMASFEEMQVPAPMLPMIVPMLNSIKEMDYDQGDLLLCSHPKSGTHWIGHLMRELRKKSPDEPEGPPMNLLEFQGAEKLSATPSPRQITTHLAPKRFPKALQNNKCKIVFVLRNPKDVAVSFFYHLKSSAMMSNKQTWDEYFVSFCEGRTPGCSYFDYLDAWEVVLKDTKSQDKTSNVEIFYFEELKQNPLENIRRLSNHLGYDKTDDELKQVIEACSIGNLREKVNKDKANVLEPLQDKDGKSVIFRKGDVGDWKNHFTVTQNEVFDKLIESRLNGSMFKFKYEL